MKIDRLFADVQLAEMEHNAFKSEASAEKLELAKLAYENALAKEEGASALKVENVEPVQSVNPKIDKIFTEQDLVGVEIGTDGKLTDEAKEKLIKNFVDRTFKEAKAKHWGVSDEKIEVVKPVKQDVEVTETVEPVNTDVLETEEKKTV